MMESIKAHAAAVGGGIGAAIAAILVWIGAQSGIDMSQIEAPLTIVITALGAWLTTYFAPANQKG